MHIFSIFTAFFMTYFNTLYRIKTRGTITTIYVLQYVYVHSQHNRDWSSFHIWKPIPIYYFWTKVIIWIILIGPIGLILKWVFVVGISCIWKETLICVRDVDFSITQVRVSWQILTSFSGPISSLYKSMYCNKK